MSAEDAIAESRMRTVAATLAARKWRPDAIAVDKGITRRSTEDDRPRVIFVRDDGWTLGVLRGDEVHFASNWKSWIGRIEFSDYEPMPRAYIAKGGIFVELELVVAVEGGDDDEVAVRSEPKTLNQLRDWLRRGCP